jgi:hypothetical protein
LIRKVAKLVTASFALGILEEKRLLAVLTEKKLHRAAPALLNYDWATEGFAQRFTPRL